MTIRFICCLFVAFPTLVFCFLALRTAFQKRDRAVLEGEYMRQLERIEKFQSLTYSTLGVFGYFFAWEYGMPSILSRIAVALAVTLLTILISRLIA